MKTLSVKTKLVLSLAALALLTAAPYRRALFGDGAFFPGDILMAHYPWRGTVAEPPKPRNGDQTDMVQIYLPYRIFVREQLKRGVVPLWNPHQMCGIPFMATGVSAVFYPLNMVFFQPMEPWRAVGWWSMFHWFLSAAGALVFLRTLGVRVSAAFAGAAAWTFSGWFMVWLQTSNTLAASAWTPWIFALYASAMRRENGRGHFALAAVLVAVQTLAGMLQISLYTAMALVGWGAFRSLFPAGGRREVRPFLAAFLIAVAGGAMAAFQLAPTFELSSLSQRSELTFRQALGYSVPFRNLPALLMPLIFGSPANPGTAWKGLAFAQHCGYLSLFALTFALAGAVSNDRRRRYFLALSIAGLALAYPTGAYAVFYWLVPGAKGLRYSRTFFFWFFGMAILTGLMADRLMQKRFSAEEAKRRFAASAVVQTLLMFGGLSVLFSRSQNAFETFKNNPAALQGFMAYWLVCLAAGGAVMIWTARSKTWRPALVLGLLIAGDQWLLNGNFSTVSDKAETFPETPSIEFLKNVAGHERVHGAGEEWVLYPNTAMVYGINDIRGYETLFPGRYREFIAAIQERHFGLPLQGLQTLELIGHRSPMTDLMGVRYFLSKEPLEDRLAEEVFRKDISVSLNERALARARLAPFWHVEPDDGKALDAMLEGRVDFNTHVVVPTTPTNALTGKAAERYEPPPPGEPYRGSVEWVEDAPNEIRLKSRANFGGLIVLADNDYPGWNAWVDGRPAEPLRAYTVFRAVYAPPGEHEVVWRFEPDSFRRGWVVSGAAFAATALFLIALRRRRSPSA